MTTATETPTVNIVDEQGGLNTGLVLDLTSATPDEIVQHLISTQEIFTNSPQGQPLTYKLAHQGTELPHDEPLSKHGVKPGDTLKLLSQMIKG